ncbi:ubiquitin ligase subunit CulD [Emericellopsis atlantica]|uniref:Ubiquitin ligase subunit CulD n=1 Tax=Emericellopsis atlantica TaxID=2614577 RepID=A0A9P7ZLD4_9HYPO|nr:ubiquitin ligase subunit CulD [Emericellopsis atlantica]KAG9253837.1 ubiquitin ligase subunit CulD [Emericellopsis atlantica]
MQPAPAPTSPRRRPRVDSSPASTSKRPKHTATPMATTQPGTRPMKMANQGHEQAFEPYKGIKRLTIKNLKPASSGKAKAGVEEYYTRALGDIDKTLQAVFVGEKPPVPYERLYREVEDLCRRGDAEEVTKVLKTRMDTHISKMVLQRVNTEGSNSDLETAKSLVEEWKQWNTQMTLIRSLFSFVDRTYLLANRQKLSSINDMTIHHFRKMAFATETSPGRRLVNAMCQIIDDDRRSRQFDGSLLRDSMRMLYILGVYTKHFEPLFLQKSSPYFTEFGQRYGTAKLEAYIKACEDLLRKEHYRCLLYNIDSVTEKQLMDAAHTILIDDFTDKLLDRAELDKLLDAKDIESMKGLYGMLRLSNIQTKLRDPWEAYIGDTGAKIIGDKERGDEMVVRLLDLRRSLEVMIRDAFGADDIFLRGMREAFGKVMNSNTVAAMWSTKTSKVGEMLAKHIDMLLKGGLKAIPASLLSDQQDRATAQKEGQSSTADEDAELDRQLDQALELFRFIEGKDTFEAFYKKDLARRLLMGRSASQDAERSMLTKLRSECGANFTHNLEQMFKDQELAKDEMDSFKSYCSHNEERQSPIDLSVMVLSSAAWPSYPDVQLSLPDEVATQTERFIKFYENKHSGRKLNWKHSLAHCTLAAKFPKGGKKELMVSAYQAVILLLFNPVAADGALTYEQMQKGSGLSGSDLDRTLQSLACGKVRVLRKHPQGRDVNPTDTFTFNKAFTDPRIRIKINQIQQKETKEENKATHERVAQDRRFETQAAIVRIMKSRKKMTHPELQAEVITMTRKRGSVEPAQIKKEIESLMEKEYLERDGNSYVYVS